MNLTFPDNAVKTFDGPVTLAEACKGMKNVIAARVDGVLRDLAAVVDRDAAVEPVPLDSPDGLHVLRHSVSHVMAGAVLELFPDGKTAIGPSTDGGFYYDFDLPRGLNEDDLKALEKRMKQVVKQNVPFARREVSADEARELMKGQPFKLELIDDIVAADPGATISLYTHDGFTDLCAGPHLPRTGAIPKGAVKLLSTAGAYWRGDERNAMLQRVYGTAFASKEALAAHLEHLKEVERRDHRRLGKDLDLYSIHPDLGAGLVMWHPAGSVVRHSIERFWFDEHRARGYDLVYTPHVASEKVYERSGHLEAYADMMYGPMEVEGARYRCKPMNCPAHILIFQSRLRSYRELPVRLAELGTVYRFERSGTLHGMLRVRGFTQDDAHIFCSREQLKDEVFGVLDLFDAMMAVFGFRCKVYLATRPEKYIGSEEEWAFATEQLKLALEERDQAYEVDEGGGVFYAPKIDYKALDALGREWQGPTCQVDLNLPERFDIGFVNADSKKERAVMVHRTVLGSMERFVGGLIEHFAGAFPLWLAPVQAVVVPITEAQAGYARHVETLLAFEGLRTRVDDRSEKMGYKIREWTRKKVPYILIAGKREEEDGTVSVRSYRDGDEGPAPLSDCVYRLVREVKEKTLP